MDYAPKSQGLWGSLVTWVMGVGVVQWSSLITSVKSFRQVIRHRALREQIFRRTLDWTADRIFASSYTSIDRLFGQLSIMMIKA